MDSKHFMYDLYLFITMMESLIEVQRDLYLCFIDYKKAFDTVKLQEIMKMIEDINIHSKDLRIIMNIYWIQQLLLG